MLGLVLVAGCAMPPAEGVDAAARDAGRLDAGAADASVSADGGGAETGDAFVLPDAFAPSDAFVLPDAFAPSDAFVLPDAFAPSDAFVLPDAFVAGDAGPVTHCVDIDVSNTCVMRVSPTSVTIPHGEVAYFCWRNRSRDYAVDVWLSYGGGYTDLATGATWNEPVRHCLGPSAHDEYADVSTACSSFRFLIHCL